MCGFAHYLTGCMLLDDYAPHTPSKALSSDAYGGLTRARPRKWSVVGVVYSIHVICYFVY